MSFKHACNQGLTSEDYSKDSCGFGLMASLRGEPSHYILEKSIEALTCMTHRGGIAADKKSGDGCGLLIQKPDEFLRLEANKLWQHNLAEKYAVGMFFMHTEAERQQQQKQIIENELKKNFSIVGWREVPVDDNCLGPIAKSCKPAHWQLLFEPIDQSLACTAIESHLFTAQINIESQESDQDFYIASLSSTLVSYKGLLMPTDLVKFYLDLQSPKLHTSIALFHQRFSTNTLPQWSLAQPFRMLAHNGEINTITGNRNWARARENINLSPILGDIKISQDLYDASKSDSFTIDTMLNFLVAGGLSMHKAMRMLIPPAWQNSDLHKEIKSFYRYSSLHMEPWDGPAGLVMTDGRYAICALDRNGLRPSRWVITNDNIITAASEIGVYSYDEKDVVRKGRVGPGDMLSIDTYTGEILTGKDIDAALSKEKPYQKWLDDNIYTLETKDQRVEISEDVYHHCMKQHMFDRDELDVMVKNLAMTGQEPTGAMGDDTPIAVLSQKNRSLYDYFRQQFSQVTNPPIDSLRETSVMSLEVPVTQAVNIFLPRAEDAIGTILQSPILCATQFKSLSHQDISTIINLNYDPKQFSLEEYIDAITKRAEEAVHQGRKTIVLTDEYCSKDKIPAPVLLALGAVQHHLVHKSMRCATNLIVATGSSRNAHHFACLLGYGATAIYPYLSYAAIDRLDKSEATYANYRKGINKGLLKIFSKMGISTLCSYRGSQLFEIIGLDTKVVEKCFRGSVSRVAGVGFKSLEKTVLNLHENALDILEPIPISGIMKYVHDKEYHAFNPDVVKYLHQAVTTGEYSAYQKYADDVNNRQVMALRDLLQLKDMPSIPIEEVESIDSIVKKFDSAGMSLGALSPEAHESLAQAMNSLGARSNSGEGGEATERYGTNKNSKIKQVASGRFGVTPHYLVNADVLQIKIAQGAKPGEGGQLPGDKVNSLIAKLRHSAVGVTLISPPPHHDIYSIEDLAQLIFDLKQVNPQALVSVKLVARPGVGTIASGVAKAYADLVTISGHDGGTAASPITSILYAGSPWELGLSETQQSLRTHGLRGKIRVQVDGGLKTGLDIIKAAILGAESFGFGTAPMVAMGCKYLRICHLNNCATGVATQNEVLRSLHYKGTVDMIRNFFLFVAQETREWMAKIGVRSLQELIGRTDLLMISSGDTDSQAQLDLAPILYKPDSDQPEYCIQDKNASFDKGELAEDMVEQSLHSIQMKEGGDYSFNITNCHRSIGARVSGEIARLWGDTGMEDNPITMRFKGIAGQSFGVWNAGGLHLILEGDANDYVGKGMAGGSIILMPNRDSLCISQETSIMGNTCLYGATGGKFFASGIAGERFAVRNSGAYTVIEGAGDHCCEYMTGGLVVVLNKVGKNFGAGMTGGIAYIVDTDNSLHAQYNDESINLHSMSDSVLHQKKFRQALEEFIDRTQSVWGMEIRDHIETYLNKTWIALPKNKKLEELCIDEQ